MKYKAELKKSAKLKRRIAVEASNPKEAYNLANRKLKPFEVIAKIIDDSKYQVYDSFAGFY